jgi:hypothetical protein
MSKLTKAQEEEKQDKRWERIVETMELEGYWKPESPPFALNKITRKAIKEVWENLRVEVE